MTSDFNTISGSFLLFELVLMILYIFSNKILFSLSISVFLSKSKFYCLLHTFFELYLFAIDGATPRSLRIINVFYRLVAPRGGAINLIAYMRACMKHLILVNVLIFLNPKLVQYSIA